jgi:predicted nucleic acid-binding protein
MILVDTSIVIDYSRSSDPRMLAIFKSCDAAICGITRAEVLHGARDSAHFKKLIGGLDSFRQEDIPTALWDQVGANLAALRTRGVTVPFADVIIASLAIHRDVELWTRDKQFGLIQNVLPALRLFTEPTP